MGIANENCFSSRFNLALQIAGELHGRQRRKGSNVPYIGHLLGVASIVIEAGGNEDQAIAALLHDAVEDQGGSPVLELIRNLFGENVAAIVASCTDADTVPKPPWRERKEKYIRHVAAASPEARLVSAADKLYNARAILMDYRVHGEKLWGRFHPDSDSLWYYRSLVVAFRAAGTNEVVEELARVVTELEQLATKKS